MAKKEDERKNEPVKQEEMALSGLENIDFQTQYKAAGAIIYTERLLLVLRMLIRLCIMAAVGFVAFYVLVKLKGYIWLLNLLRGSQ